MKVANIAKSPSFGSALCTQQENELKRLEKIALSDNHLGINTISTTFFDFTIPAGKYNTGIGTTFSNEMIDTAEFANTYFGTTNIQVGPQGEISNSIRSPYSGTTFSLGEQYISPEKLATEDYGNLLTRNDLDNSPYMNGFVREDIVDYEHLFSKTDGIKPLLAKAYENFKTLPDDSQIKLEFDNFKNSNQYWLERDSLFEAMAQKYGNNDVNTWQEKDQNLFADENNIDYNAINNLKQVTDENGNNVVEYNEFVQFIADKQQQEAKKRLNSMGIKLSGDCQIGFNQKDVWAHKSAFYKDGRMFGCDRDGDGKFITCWTPAADMDKLDGEAGELFRQKFATQFKRYDTVRIDAAWQLIYPTIVNPEYKDENGNLRGSFADNQPKVGAKIINIIKDEAKKAGVCEREINLELLDGAGKSWKALNNKEVKDAIKDMYCIHTMQYMGKSWGYPSHYRSDRAGAFKHPFEISIGTHDDKTAIACAENMNDTQTEIISNELKIPKFSLKSIPQRLSGLYSMLFTNSPKNKDDFKGKVSITIPDAVGSSKRINIPNTQDGNWEFRLGRNWQENYFKNLTEGYGFNLPEALSTALKAKEGESDLTRGLDKFANILKSKEGPMTREEANEMYKNGTLNTIA